MLLSVFITPSMDFNQIKSNQIKWIIITGPHYWAFLLLMWKDFPIRGQARPRSSKNLRRNICNVGSQIGFIRVHGALMCTIVPLKSSQHLDIRSNDDTIPAALPADLVSLWQRRQSHWGRNCVLPLQALLVIHNHTTQWEGTLYRASSLTTRLHLRFLSNQASGRSLSLPRPEFSCASVPLLGTPHHHTDCCRGRSGLAGPLDLRTLSLNGHSMIFLVYCPYHFCLQCNYEG